MQTKHTNLANKLKFITTKKYFTSSQLQAETKKFLTEDRTYSSSREKISSSFKSAQETSLFKAFSSLLSHLSAPPPSQTPAVQPLQASAFLALLRSRLAR